MPPSSTADQSNADPSSDLPLLHQEIRYLRGLKSRWENLQRSRSVDVQSLHSQKDDEKARYVTNASQLVRANAEQLSSVITSWDAQRDERLAVAERDTLQLLGDESREIGALKSNYKGTRREEKTLYGSNRAALQSRFDNSKKNAATTRDSVRAKLDREKNSLDEMMHESREWIGIKTGSPALIHWTAPDAPEGAGNLVAITTLDEVAARFEEQKERIHLNVKRLHSHPALRLVNPPLLITVSVIAGVTASAIGNQLQTPPLIWSAIGVSAAILVPALLALSASPILSRAFRRLFPPIVEQERVSHLLLQQGRKLADQFYQNEVNKLERQFAVDARVLESKHKARLLEIEDEFEKKKHATVANARQGRTVCASHRIQSMQQVDEVEHARIEQLKSIQLNSVSSLKKNYERSLDRLRLGFEESQSRAVRRWSDGIEALTLRVQAARQKLQTEYPNWSSTEMQSGAWPRSDRLLAWPIGNIQPEMTPPGDHPDAVGLTQLASRMQGVGPLPIAFDLLHHGSLILHADAASQPAASGLVRQVLLRSITSLPAGAIHTTIIDPEGLGKRFSWIMHLADIDPLLVNHRVWTQPVHIADQLEMTARHIEDVIQQSLRNRYSNLHEYNAQAGPMAIPYRLLVWSGFPFGLDEHSWQSLCSILSSGGRCGVGVVLQIADNCKWPPFVDPNKLSEFGLHLQLRSEHDAGADGDSSRPKTSVRVLEPELEPFEMTMETPPDENQTRSVMEHQMVAAGNIGKRIVPFSSIAPHANAIQQASSADGLEIPIGISDSGRTQALRLGAGTSQHVLIAGKTGSGKSSLLHTIITSAALNYAPDELRMVLLDFKKGVEFQVYAELELPHTDIIGIESRREFGLSTLEYLDRILSMRGEAFRGWGVQDLPSLKRKHPDIKLPRILIVIDEFQEMFVEDDKLSQQASMLVDRLVRQGRSFGMHLVLASQTLGGSYSLPRTTLSQMAVRVALQCDSSDAMLILSEDNSAAERLRHSGQGIYNEAGGRFEGNQNFQVSFLEKKEQLERLGDFPPFSVSSQPTINPLGRRIVFEGHKPSKWDNSSIRAAIDSLSPVERLNLPWPLGDSVSIEPPIVRSMVSTAGRNAMIIGSEEACVASLIAGWIQGWSIACPTDAKESPAFWILDGTRSDDTELQATLRWAVDTQQPVRIASPRELDPILGELATELERRLGAPDQTHPPMAFLILNISRFRELRRNEDFSFSSDGGGMIKPDAILAKLLADGPAVGMHVCVWADSASSLNRWLSRGSLRDIEIRVLMQMSAADSNQLIDSSLANRLDRYVHLIHDDADGKSTKFRPFLLGSILTPSKLT